MKIQYKVNTRMRFKDYLVIFTLKIGSVLGRQAIKDITRRRKNQIVDRKTVLTLMRFKTNINSNVNELPSDQLL